MELRRPAHAAALGLGAFALAASLASALVLSDLAEQRAVESEQRAEQERWDDFVEVFASLPALATLEAPAAWPGPPQVAAADEGLGEQLDRLLALEPNEPLLRWYRIQHASQVGDLERCAGELAELEARGLTSPLVQALATLLLDEDPAARNHLARPEDLPAPEGAFDHAVLGHLAHRWRDSGRAWTELSAALVLEPDAWLVRDLRILPGMERAWGEGAIEDALRVEDVLGRPTVRTLHARAFAADGRGQVQHARDLWHAALELEPHQRQALHGLGRSSYGMQEYERARDELEAAAAAKPGFWNAYLLLARCAQEQGRFDEAFQVLDRAQAELDGLLGDEGFHRAQLDLGLEQIDVKLAQAIALSDEGLSDLAPYVEAKGLLADLVGRLGTQLSPGTLNPIVRASLEVELTSLGVSLDAHLGVVSPQVALERQLELLVEHCTATGYQSSVVTTHLGLAYLALGEEGRSEAQAWLSLDPSWGLPHSLPTLAMEAATRPIGGVASEAGYAQDHASEGQEATTQDIPAIPDPQPE